MRSLALVLSQLDKSPGERIIRAGEAAKVDPGRRRLANEKAGWRNDSHFSWVAEENLSPTLDPTPNPLTPSIASVSAPAESLNASSILSSTSPAFPVTISPVDVTSFTTDHQQTPWLPPPPPSLPQASQSPQSTDFVLYPSGSTPQVPDWNPPPRQHPLAQNTIVHSLHPRTLVQSQRRHSYQQTPPHSYRQLQDPRVISVISQTNRYPITSSPRSYSLGGNSRSQSRFYAASAPASSPRPVRPPVPLFSETDPQSQSTVNIQQQIPNKQAPPQRRVMSTSTLPQGSYCLYPPHFVINQMLNLVPDFADLVDFADGLESVNVDSLLGLHKSTVFTPINDPAMHYPNDGTVSPKDLMMDHSAPPSTSFTDLSTPSFDSPGGYFSNETSPLFMTDELGPGSEQWASLFPDQPVIARAPQSVMSVSEAHSSVPPSPVISNLQARPDPSPVQSPRPAGRPANRHSSVSGVKSRHRDKPLPPINFDVTDPVASKRARNTEAARKSRARKVEHQEKLENRIAELEKLLQQSEEREEYWKSMAESRPN
ncbi:hypothetical protein FQN57_005161 [Myotisia sp. PD_48]|nr:hypothetical protein FQN57_005161 [Myotisia sp. PD_48]